MIRIADVLKVLKTSLARVVGCTFVTCFCFLCSDKANTSVTSAFLVNYTEKIQQVAMLGL